MILCLQFLLVIDALNKFLGGIVLVLYFGTSNFKAEPRISPWPSMLLPWIMGFMQYIFLFSVQDVFESAS